MRWRVYKFTKPNTFEFIGNVEGDHEPGARGKAMKQWPEFMKRIHLHREDAKTCHCAMPRKEGKVDA